MSYTVIQNARIFLMLVYRDILVIRQKLGSMLLDASIELFVNITTFGALLPVMGMPRELIVPLYIGGMTAQMFYFAYSFSYSVIFDIRYDRFIDYRLTLPISKKWLFASYITKFVMETAIITAPLMTIGLFILRSNAEFINPQPLLFIAAYISTLVLFGTMFFGFSLYYEYDWFMQNIWARRLNFLFLFSPLFLVWHRVYDFSPVFARLMLLSPLTYAVEGLRSTLLGGPQYIPVPLCFFGIGIFMVLYIILIIIGAKKRLDPL